MQLHQLEYVLAVAKHRNFSKASEEIRISQSSLSQQIINLEKELGVDLFIRTTRSVTLTPTGTDFVVHATRVMEELAATRKCVQEYVAVEKGHLTFGIIPVVGHYPIPKLLAAFNRKFIGVKLNLVENQDDELLIMLNNSALDAAIVQSIPPGYDFEAFPLYKDVMVFLTNTQHPLAYRKMVSLKELREEKFIVPPMVSGHYHDFENACNTVGFDPKIFMTCSSVATILALVREGMGTTVLSSKSAAMGAGDPLLRTIEINPAIKRNIYLVIQKNINISPVLKTFVQYTAQWIGSNATA